MIQLPEKYRNAKVLDQTPNLVLIETVDGNSFWVRRNNSVAPTSDPGAAHCGKKPKRLGLRDSDGSIIYNAEGLERLHRGFAARPRVS
jgi:hypothetical protein